MGAPQLSIVLPQTQAEREAEADRQSALRDEMMLACRAVARELTYDVCARELDAVWGPKGRAVSASALRSALHDVERNNFRFEWILWFATQSEDVADLLAEISGRGKPKKKPEDELRDLKALIREELPKRATALIRKAESP